MCETSDLSSKRWDTDRSSPSPELSDHLRGKSERRVLSARGSTIGEGRDATILSPGRSPKQPLPGIGLHDPLHGRQACPEFIAFDQGFGQICPR